MGGRAIRLKFVRDHGVALSSDINSKRCTFSKDEPHHPVCSLSCCRVPRGRRDVCGQRMPPRRKRRNVQSDPLRRRPLSQAFMAPVIAITTTESAQTRAMRNRSRATFCLRCLPCIDAQERDCWCANRQENGAASFIRARGKLIHQAA